MHIWHKKCTLLFIVHVSVSFMLSSDYIFMSFAQTICVMNEWFSHDVQNKQYQSLGVEFLWVLIRIGVAFFHHCRWVLFSLLFMFYHCHFDALFLLTVAQLFTIHILSHKYVVFNHIYIRILILDFYSLSEFYSQTYNIIIVWIQFEIQLYT